MINIVYMVLKKRNLYNIITDSRCAGFAHKYIHIYAYINIAEYKYTHQVYAYVCAYAYE